MEKIDFVVLWVNGNDPKWIKEKEKYSNCLYNDNIANSIVRYRDWDNLQYWFRGIEKYTPWVNKIHFITYGHIPKWLDTKNEKLNIVRHEDFIPKEFLPTFNSNVIELNLKNIKGLSENFVLFNDDMFIINRMSESDFFKNNLPKDECVQNAIIPFGNNDKIVHALINNVDIINRNFSKKRQMSKYFLKNVNPKYGIRNLRTLFLLPWWAYTGFYNYHLPISYKKDTFRQVWNREERVLLEACKNKFRSETDVTHWTMRYWQLCSGEFYPRCSNIGKYFEVSLNNKKIINCIEKQKCKMICINDTNTDFDFEKAKKELLQSFNKILPSKSSFEI